MNEEKKCQNIYIVDDIQENIQVLGNILIEKGFNIQIARNGKQLLSGIRKRIPDLILLDVSMPEMDGYEVCKSLKADKATKDIPVIFLTARTEKKDIVKGLNTGGVDYITKPFHTDELIARVNTHLELKNARDTIIQQKEELQKKNDELYKVSITDNLTGIYNRLHILDVLKKEFSRAKRHSTDLSCIIFDLDFFKKINDTYGHLTGDFVLKETAERVNSIIRREDYLGRYGGEEFVIILPETDTDGAYKSAEKVRKKIENSSYNVDGSEISVTISLGISSLKRSNPENEGKMLFFTDTALYKAKENGRNRTEIFSE